MKNPLHRVLINLCQRCGQADGTMVKKTFQDRETGAIFTGYIHGPQTPCSSLKRQRTKDEVRDEVERAQRRP